MDSNKNFPIIQESLECCQEQMQPVFVFMYLSQGKGNHDFLIFYHQTLYFLFTCVKKKNCPPIKPICNKYWISIYLKIHHDDLFCVQLHQNLAIAEPPLKTDHWDKICTFAISVDGLYRTHRAKAGYNQSVISLNFYLSLLKLCNGASGPFEIRYFVWQ